LVRETLGEVGAHLRCNAADAVHAVRQPMGICDAKPQSAQRREDRRGAEMLVPEGEQGSGPFKYSYWWTSAPVADLASGRSRFRRT
jgi:hypothetical protein